jgi:hypothetical protein
LASLVQEVYYKTNKFWIEIVDLEDVIEDKPEHPKPRTAAMIRHLHVKIVEDFLVSLPNADIMCRVHGWLLKLQEPSDLTHTDTE